MLDTAIARTRTSLDVTSNEVGSVHWSLEQLRSDMRNFESFVETMAREVRMLEDVTQVHMHSRQSTSGGSEANLPENRLDTTFSSPEMRFRSLTASPELSRERMGSDSTIATTTSLSLLSEDGEVPFFRSATRVRDETMERVERVMEHLYREENEDDESGDGVHGLFDDGYTRTVMSSPGSGGGAMMGNSRSSLLREDSLSRLMLGSTTDLPSYGMASRPRLTTLQSPGRERERERDWGREVQLLPPIGTPGRSRDERFGGSASSTPTQRETRNGDMSWSRVFSVASNLAMGLGTERNMRGILNDDGDSVTGNAPSYRFRGEDASTTLRNLQIRHAAIATSPPFAYPTILQHERPGSSGSGRPVSGTSTSLGGAGLTRQRVTTPSPSQPHDAVTLYSDEDDDDVRPFRRMRTGGGGGNQQRQYKKASSSAASTIRLARAILEGSSSASSLDGGLSNTSSEDEGIKIGLASGSRSRDVVVMGVPELRGASPVREIRRSGRGGGASSAPLVRHDEEMVLPKPFPAGTSIRRPLTSSGMSTQALNRFGRPCQDIEERTQFRSVSLQNPTTATMASVRGGQDIEPLMDSIDSIHRALVGCGRALSSLETTFGDGQDGTSGASPRTRNVDRSDVRE
ncbi:hypothetical protein HDU97_009051 [Phlyctochytrium planicorne]|nr:hypothetical protein HDU97_009051 [Phlyctochytrium planicorne]